MSARTNLVIAPSACPDCPATRTRALHPLLPSRSGACAFRCASVAQHEVLPERWLTYGFGLVRRGVVIRQRIDAHGRATAIDAVGPGGFFPLDGAEPSARARGVTGYAATDVLVCLCPADVSDLTLDGSSAYAQELLSLHREALDRVERIADARARSTAKGRVAALLLALCDTLHAAGTPHARDALHAELQQRDLAALVSLRHESVCRVLGSFAASGWIAQGRDGVRLLDRARLEAV